MLHLQHNFNLEQSSMARKVLLLFIVCYLAILGMLALSLHNASPGPASQEILGVGIGSHYGAEGIVYLSGRYLHCSRPTDQLWAASCTIEIADQLLEIRAQRNPPEHPNELGGQCEAFYAGKQWPCQIDSPHLQVFWFAFLEEPLGLSKDQLADLRQHYLLENLPESVFLNGIALEAIITAILALLTVGLWLWPRVSNKLLYALTATGCAVITGWVSFFLAMFLTNGFWD
jgi:hypothetical protein